MIAADALPYAEVIGDPVQHSKSPLIHRFWLEKLGMAARYEACHIRTDALEAYFQARRRDPAWRGCNITLPHKIAALDFVGDPGGIRASIGAINTVFAGHKGEWTGTNTDAGGFFLPLAEMDWSGQSAIVLGSGGAARAVLFALAQADIGDVTILAHSGLHPAGLLAHFGLKGRALPMDAKLPPAQLLVNASPLGMAGQDALTIDLSPLPPSALVYDLVYVPLITPLLQPAAARGLDIVDGLDMLIGQAALAFELFFGASPPPNCEDELREKLLK